MNNKLDGISDIEMYDELKYREENNNPSNDKLINITNNEMILEMNYRYERKQYFNDKFFIVDSYIIRVLSNFKEEVLQNNKYNLDDIHNIMFNNVKKHISFVLDNINNDIDLTNNTFYKFMIDEYNSCSNVKPDEVEGIIKKVINNLINDKYFNYDDIHDCINYLTNDMIKLLKKEY